MRMSHRSFYAALAIVLFGCGQLQAGVVYVALGDSTTFGNNESVPSSTQPNFGDQGYVRPFANFLGTLNGGVRPDVVNLGISGELSMSFLTGVPPTDWLYRSWQWNLHYPTATTSQNSLAIAALDAAHTAGNTVWLTLNFGTNDFTHLVSSSAYQSATPIQQQALFLQVLGQVVTNYETVLTEVETHAPGTHILLPGFFNNTLPSDPAYAIKQAAVEAGDQALEQIAPAFGAKYVDFSSIISGHQSELTNIQVAGGGHLNEAGYAAVAGALATAAIPEPIESGARGDRDRRHGRISRSEEVVGLTKVGPRLIMEHGPKVANPPTRGDFLENVRYQSPPSPL